MTTTPGAEKLSGGGVTLEMGVACLAAYWTTVDLLHPWVGNAPDQIGALWDAAPR